MVRETRHLWVGNLPDNIREDRIREHFKRYGRVQSVKILARGSSKDQAISDLSPGGASGGGGPGAAAGGGGCPVAASGGLACTVAFMDIKSASKAHTAEHKLDDRTLTTEYYEPAAIPSAAAAQSLPGGYATSPAAQRFPNSHGSTEEHSGFGERFYERGSTRVSDAEYLRRPGYHEGPRGRARDRLYRGNGGPYATLIERRGWGYETATPRYATGGSSGGGGVGGSSVGGGGGGGGGVGGGGGGGGNNSIILSATSVVEPLSSGSSSSGGGSSSGSYPLPVEPLIVPPLERRVEASVVVLPSSSSSAAANKKKIKSSRSGSESPSGSTSSRSPSRSRSSSPSTSSGTGTSSRASSSSPQSAAPRGRSLQSAVSAPAPPPVHSEDRRPLAICVRNLPARSSDTSLKDGLFHEYKKHGKVTWVKVVGQSSDRYALVCFKKPDDVEKALEVSYDKLFFGCKIEVAPYQGYDVDDNEFRPYEAELDEFHPKATRTLFVGNLEKDVTASELRKHFEQFGEIIEIDIKKQGAVSSYAFCQYADIGSVVKAIRTMDGEHLGNNRVKLGFGKSMPTSCVWVDGVSEAVSDKYLNAQFHQFGPVTQVAVDRERGHALIFFEQIPCAQTAVKEMRGVALRGRKLQVDFASRECQEAFYEHLEKQGGGAAIERPGFEAVREPPASRVFDSTPATVSAAAATTNRFRYDTPTRPRTSSYSRSSAASSQCASAVPSPGSASSRVRLTRYVDYYESGSEYPSERRFRNYDEFSQGSTEDLYEHDSYASETPTLQSVVVAAEPLPSTAVPFAPPDIRHLQKERVHLLEQLEECPSSGDEHISPKKRLKLEMQLMDGGASSGGGGGGGPLVLDPIEMNHKNELRRLSESSRHSHLSRRPSTDTSNCRPIINCYTPNAVCKRRKTGGSSVHHEISGGESIDGSRPGTPLCDERPENLIPSEPRRIRERNTHEGPLSLPLPRFAAQFRLQGGFRSALVTSPPPVAAPLPPPSPVHVPPPASPPPRPPSLSSNSSDSDGAPASPSVPSLDERIRSVVEKYEKWSGSRTLSAAGGDALTKVDAAISEKFRFRHKLLDVDLKEVPPSEIVKSVLAKRSVFDEDSKRLENFGEKYEPREFVQFQRTIPGSLLAPNSGSAAGVTVVAQAVAPQQPVYSSPGATSLKTLPGTSPKIPPAKGLQYPFPSHPPALPLTPATPGTPGMLPSSPMGGLPPISSGASTTCTVIPADIRSGRKASVNALASSSSSASCSSSSSSASSSASSSSTMALSATTPSGTSERVKTVPNRTVCATTLASSGSVITSVIKSNKLSDNEIKINIPVSCVNASSTCEASPAAATAPTTCLSAAATLVNVTADTLHYNHCNPPPKPDKFARKDDKSSDKLNKSDRSINNKKDTVTQLVNSPITTVSKKDRKSNKHEKDSDSSEYVRGGGGDQASSAGRDPDALATATAECDRKRDSETCDRQMEDERRRRDGERQDEAARRLEREGLERAERERLEVERVEKERLERERLEKERLARENLERERADKEKADRERLEREKQHQEREKIERDRKRERDEKERREREERQRKEREDILERERIENEERKKLEAAELERERVEKERHDKSERDRLEKEQQRIHKEKFDKDKREKDEEITKHEKPERRYKEESHDRKRDKDGHRHKENHISDDCSNKSRHRENHIDGGFKPIDRHRDNHLESKNNYDTAASRKDANKDHDGSKVKENHEIVRNHHESIRKESSKDYDTPSRNSHEISRTNHDRRGGGGGDDTNSSSKHNHIGKNHHDHEGNKSRHHFDKEELRHKESSSKKEKENRELNHHERKHTENNKHSTEGRPIESRHLSLDSDKTRPYNDHTINSLTPNRIEKRKERNNSSPASVGLKRRFSSQDILQSNATPSDDVKRLKLSDHKKLPDRRDSKESSRSTGDRPKHNKHSKNNFTKMLEDKIREDKRAKDFADDRKKEQPHQDKDKDRDKEQNKPPRDKQLQRSSSDRHKSSSKSKPRERESGSGGGGGGGGSTVGSSNAGGVTRDSPPTPSTPKTPSSGKELTLDKDFLARLDLRANDDDEKHKQNRKEKRLSNSKQFSQESEDRKSCSDDSKHEERKKEKHERKGSRDESVNMFRSDEQRKTKREERRLRKITISSDTTDSDEPKKHSIFDIVDDTPAYISMYDKVKARSCKNMQKQEEEKRQEKIKAKFSQLKQSRAKREEKKRSTSWDEDSDSDERATDRGGDRSAEHHQLNSKQARRGNKMIIISSSDDEEGGGHHRKQRKNSSNEYTTDSDPMRLLIEELKRMVDSSDDGSARTKSMSRKGSKSRIASDTSEDEHTKSGGGGGGGGGTITAVKEERYSDSEGDLGYADSEEKVDVRRHTFKQERLDVAYDTDKYIKKEKGHGSDTKRLSHDFTDDDTREKPDVKEEDLYITEFKSENHKFSDTLAMLCDASSEGESNHVMQNSKTSLFLKSENRRKHKKKQKRQKSLLLDDVVVKTENVDNIEKEEIVGDDKIKLLSDKKKHTKKDKKRDKIKDEAERPQGSSAGSKLKKSKKSTKCELGTKTENLSAMKRDEKMQDIFGPFSDDSENGGTNSKEAPPSPAPPVHAPVNNIGEKPVANSFYDRFGGKLQVSLVYGSDSDSISNLEASAMAAASAITKSPKLEERDKLKDENKKRKEKKRKEKEQRRLEREVVVNNENSVDLAEVGRVLEAKLLDEIANDIAVMDKIDTDQIKIEPDEEVVKIEVNTDADVFRFTDGDDSLETEKKDTEKKEPKEKKKKRKKSKDEKHNRKDHHHHYYHHSKSEEKPQPVEIQSSTTITSTATTITSTVNATPLVDSKSTEMVLEIDIKSSRLESPSLPSLLDVPSPPPIKAASSPNLNIPKSPVMESMISPIPKTPTSASKGDKKQFIPGFGAEIDQCIHESAVKSISDFSPTPTIHHDIPADDKCVETKAIKTAEPAEDKPRVVISQEETEDAVAALLGESFGGDDGQFDAYNDDVTSPTVNDGIVNATEVSIPEDDEEMRQAVQSLNASGDLEVMKPDTPLSEHDLQIDTDTDDDGGGSDDVVSLRYEHPPKTPEIVDFSQPPKTPDVHPSSYYNEPPPLTKEVAPPTCVTKTSTTSKTTTTVVATPPLAIVPPEGTTVHKPQLRDINAICRKIEANLTEKKIIVPPAPILVKSEIPALPVPENSQPSVIAKPWSLEQKQRPAPIVLHAASTAPPSSASITKGAPAAVTATAVHNSVDTKLTPSTALSIAQSSTAAPSAATTSVVSSQKVPVTPRIMTYSLIPPTIKIPDTSLYPPKATVYSPLAALKSPKSSTMYGGNGAELTAPKISMPLLSTAVSSTQSPLVVASPHAQQQQQQQQAPVSVPTMPPTNIHLSVPTPKLVPLTPPTVVSSAAAVSSVATTTTTPAPAPSLTHNRLPITPVLAPISSKALQPQNMLLPQSKTAVHGVVTSTMPPAMPKLVPPQPLRMVISPGSGPRNAAPPYTSTFTQAHIIAPAPNLIQVTARMPVVPHLNEMQTAPPTVRPPFTAAHLYASKEPLKMYVESANKQTPAITSTYVTSQSSLGKPTFAQTTVLQQNPMTTSVLNTTMLVPNRGVVTAPELSTAPSLVPLSARGGGMVGSAPPPTTTTTTTTTSENRIPTSIIQQAPAPPPIMVNTTGALPTRTPSPAAAAANVIVNKPISAELLPSKICGPVGSNVMVMPRDEVVPGGVIEMTNVDKETVRATLPCTTMPDFVNAALKGVPPPAKHDLAPTSTKCVSDPDNKFSAVEMAATELGMQLTKERETKHIEAAKSAEVNDELTESKSIDEGLDMKVETATSIIPMTEESNADNMMLHLKTVEAETVSVIRETDLSRFEDDKTEDAESGISDMSKENMRLSADILENKEDPLDSKEDSDYWSAKEVNIESVIKTVDALCSADELSEGSDVGKEDWYDAENKSTESDAKLDKSLNLSLDSSNPNLLDDPHSEPDISHDMDNDLEHFDEGIDNCHEGREIGRGGRRGNRMRGRKTQAKNVDRIPSGVQTRRAGKKEISCSVLTRRGVARTITTRGKSDRKLKREDSEHTSDVYEFHDDSDESKNHPRLIMTIKSSAGNISNTTPTVVVKEAPPTSPAKSNKAQEFVSPAANTRKSARLQERDGSRNTIDDTIEDVVRNMVTRSAGNATVPLQSLLPTEAAEELRNAAIITRSGTVVQGPPGVIATRRSTRQNLGKPTINTPMTPETRKSTRGAKKNKDRRTSDATDDSSEEKSSPTVITKKDETVDPNKLANKTVISPTKALEDEKRSESLLAHGRKAAMMRRLKGDVNNEEPQTLIDPVTGLLLVMKESEGKYITISTIAPTSTTTTVLSTRPATEVLTTTSTHATLQRLPPQPAMAVTPHSTSTVCVPAKEQPPTVIASQQSPMPLVMTVQTKPQSLKAHVLSSQAAKAAISQLQSFQNPLNQSQPIQKAPQTPQPMPQTIQHQPAPGFAVKPNTNLPFSQNLNVNVSSANPITINLSPRQNIVHHVPKISPVGPPMTIQNPKQHLLQAVNKPPNMPAMPKLNAAPINPKTYLLSAVNQGHNVTPIAPMHLVKPAHMVVSNQMGSIGPNKVMMGQSPPLAMPGKSPSGLHPQQQQIMTGAVASPPLKQHLMGQQPIVTGASSGRMMVAGTAPTPGVVAKGVMDPPKLDPALSTGCVLVTHPSASPQHRGQAVQPDMPIAAYEASLHGVSERSTAFSRSRQQSPPPAHQQMSPSPQSEPTLSHLAPPSPYGPAHVYHYMRPQQRPYQISRSPHILGGIEKAGDGQEGEEAPVTSPPPLELRRPGSNGTTLVVRPGSAAGLRPTAVPHGLQSPHNLQSSLDRATDSPQVAPVYMHGARMLHYGAAPGSGGAARYYETPGEPPPAHRAHSVGPLPPSVAHTGARSYLHPAPQHMPTTFGRVPQNIAGAMVPTPRHTAGVVDAENAHRALHGTPPHVGQVDSLSSRLKFLYYQEYPIKWQGLLALKNDTAAVQMYYVFGNQKVATDSLPFNSDGSTPPLRIAQRMRLDKVQIEGVARKLGEEREHCVLLALPCGQNRDDVVQQSSNLNNGFINYLQEKQAAGIVNIAAPDTHQAAFVIHMFPSCDFANEYLQRTAPELFSRVAGFAHLIIIIATV